MQNEAAPTRKIPEGLVARKTCRVCSSGNLELVLSLGTQCISDFVGSPTEEAYSAPLELVFCDRKKGGCGLLQLRHTVPPELLYRNYWYKSGVNQTMRKVLADIAHKAETLVELGKGDIVIDIGCNDGTLLRSYKAKDIVRLGFEPAANLVEEAEIGTTGIINDFFSHRSFEREYGDGKAKVITAIAMFYDLEDPNAFVQDITRLLDGDGVLVIQMNYLGSMLENNAFDNIVHEHLEYYSLGSLRNLLSLHDLEVFDVELNDVNGGSFRVYVKHRESVRYSIESNVAALLESEEKMHLDDYETYEGFRRRVCALREQTHGFIRDEVIKGRRVFLYGASTRGNTLLQFYNLNNELIEAAAERNPTKWGKTTVGTLIPIISEEQAREKKPDYFLILPWYFLEEFKRRERKYLDSGGKFIVPLPQFRIVDSNG